MVLAILMRIYFFSDQDMDLDEYMKVSRRELRDIICKSHSLVLSAYTCIGKAQHSISVRASIWYTMMLAMAIVIGIWTRTVYNESVGTGTSTTYEFKAFIDDLPATRVPRPHLFGTHLECGSDANFTVQSRLQASASSGYGVWFIIQQQRRRELIDDLIITSMYVCTYSTSELESI